MRTIEEFMKHMEEEFDESSDALLKKINIVVGTHTHQRLVEALTMFHRPYEDEILGDGTCYNTMIYHQEEIVEIVKMKFKHFKQDSTKMYDTHELTMSEFDVILAACYYALGIHGHDLIDPEERKVYVNSPELREFCDNVKTRQFPEDAVSVFSFLC